MIEMHLAISFFFLKFVVYPAQSAQNNNNSEADKRRAVRPPRREGATTRGTGRGMVKVFFIRLFFIFIFFFRVLLGVTVYSKCT